MVGEASEFAETDVGGDIAESAAGDVMSDALGVDAAGVSGDIEMADLASADVADGVAEVGGGALAGAFNPASDVADVFTFGLASAVGAAVGAGVGAGVGAAVSASQSPPTPTPGV